MQQPNQPATTIAVLGADTIVGRTLCVLLESHSYRTSPIDAHPAGVADELLEGTDLLLLAPRLDEGAREAFVGAVGKSDPRHARPPVIALSTPLEEVPLEGVISVPWPCETRVLVERIEAALARQPHCSTGG